MTKRVWIIPVVIAALATAGVVGARFIVIPTLTFTYDDAFAGRARRAEFTVSGVRCYGTADYLREHIETLPGLVGLVAYAGKRRVVVDFDAAKTNPEAIIRAIEAPIKTKTGPQSFYEVISWELK